MSDKELKEQRAHDLAVAYEAVSAIKVGNDFVDPNYFFQNYKNSYQEFLKLLNL